MNAIFLKEVPNSVIKGNFAKLNFTNISEEEYIIEINISSKSINSIKKSNIKLKQSVILEPVRFIWINNLYIKYRTLKLNSTLSKIIKRNNLIGYNVVYSNNIKKDSKIKDFFNSFFNEYNIKEYINISTVKENIDKYIEDYIARNNLKIESIKPLIVVNEIDNIDLDLINMLNNKYKEINIFTSEKTRKCFINKINKINDEYGSCISILDKARKDFKQYNVYIFIDKSKFNYIGYKFNKKACYIDFTNTENDKYNRKYIKKEEEIKKNNYYGTKIKELYEIYGRNTIASIIID